MLFWKSFTAEKIDWVKGSATGFLLILAAILVIFAVRKGKPAPEEGGATC
jgi:hypothetical protein